MMGPPLVSRLPLSVSDVLGPVEARLNALLAVLTAAPELMTIAPATVAFSAVLPVKDEVPVNDKPDPELASVMTKLFA